MGGYGYEYTPQYTLDSIPSMKEFIVNESTPIGDPEHLPGVEGETLIALP